MYNSHPSQRTYGNPGFYVANPTGNVRDASGRLVDLRPDTSERSTRRIMVRTSELQKNSDGAYVAKIRKAKNVTAIKLSYASIPRPVSRVTAQLILYSIAIKKNSTSIDHQKIALQRMCRNQLLSSDTSDVPFFQMSASGFDWRNSNSSTSAWINSFDRNTFIPPQFESEINNQYIDIDVLTVKVPSMCTLNSLGIAFSNALRSHSGAENTRNNSIWTSFDISVEETGFSVFENINDADVFTTFAALAPPYVTPDNDPFFIRQNQSAVDSFIPMGTPLKIRMKKSRSVFVSNDTFTGASTSPAYICPSFSNMTEFSPSKSTGGTDLSSFETIIDTSNKFVYSFSCIGEVSENDILEVEYHRVVELHVTELPTTDEASDQDISDPTFSVTYYYGAALTGSFTLILISDDSTIEFDAIADDDNSQRVKINGKFNVSTGVLKNLDGNETEVRMGSSFFHHSPSATTLTVSEVKRTYQKTRDIRLGLRWGNNKENYDFFIDTNHSLDSPVITNDPNIQSINPNYNFVGQHRRDVALLSQYSKKVRGNTEEAVDSNKLNLKNLQPENATIIPGMIVSTSNDNAMNPSLGVTVQSVSSTVNSTPEITLSQAITVAADAQFTFEVAPTSDSTYHNMLRNTGDLEDTYIHSTSTSSEIHNVHQVNDAHQIQKMLFTGHMMNVTEPSAMPVEDDDFPDHTTGQRPRVNVS